MTAPSYTTNLSTLDQAESNTNWVEFTGTSTNGYDYNIHGSPQGADADWPYIQNTYAVTQTCTSTKSGYGSLGYDNGSSIGGHGTDGAYFVWQLFANPNYYSYANDGLQVLAGDAVGSFYAWTVGGNDVGVGLYLGWQNHVINTTVTPDDNAGSYAGTGEEIVGAAVRTTTGIGKGEPHCVDAIRYGRGDAVFEYGDLSNGYCTIAGFAAQNDSINNRWGLIQEVPGGYLWKGLMQLGSTSNAVDFRDSDRIIFIQWCPKVTSNFNTIEVKNASSNVEMTNFQFIQLDTSTASDGRWITTNDATVSLDNCSFQDMGTFTFDSNTTADECSFIRCLQVDPGGGDLSFSSVLESAVTGGGSTGGGALLWNDASDPNTYLNDMTFTKGAGSHHAIEFGTSAPTTINLTNVTVSGFHASNQQTTSALYFPDTGGDVTWTVAHTGTTGTLSYYKARSGDTVNITSSVSVTITVKDTDGNLLDNVQTAVYKTSDRTEIMNEDTVSGVAQENYTGSTPVEVEVRCRKASSGATKYKNYSSTQTIGTGGLTMTVTMVEDPYNNATS
jgi:hypothetical protein